MPCLPSGSWQLQERSGPGGFSEVQRAGQGNPIIGNIWEYLKIFGICMHNMLLQLHVLNEKFKNKQSGLYTGFSLGISVSLTFVSLTFVSLTFCSSTIENIQLTLLWRVKLTQTAEQTQKI